MYGSRASISRPFITQYMIENNSEHYLCRLHHERTSPETVHKFPKMILSVGFQASAFFLRRGVVVLCVCVCASVVTIEEAHNESRPHYV